MNNEERYKKLYNAITDINDEMIEKALDYTPRVNSRPSRTGASIIFPFVAAAILVAALVLAFVFRNKNAMDNNLPPQSPDNAVVVESSESSYANDEENTEPGTTTDDMMLIRIPGVEMPAGGGGMDSGNDGSVYYSDTYPNWNDLQDYDSLPVYINRGYDPTGTGIPLGLSLDDMYNLLYEAAASADLVINDTNVVQSEIYMPGSADPEYYPNISVIDSGNDEHSDKTYDPDDYHEAMLAAGYVKCLLTERVTALLDQGQLDVYANGEVRWILSIPTGGYPDTSDHLPEELQFSVPYGTDEEAERAAQYYMEKYSEFIGFADPKVIVVSDTNDMSEIYRRFRVYDLTGDVLADNLNYTFNGVSLMINSDGDLQTITRSNRLDFLDYYGDYPVISKTEAYTELLQGNYIDMLYNTWEIIGDDPDIVNEDLIYRSGSKSEYYLPYYRFTVKLTDPTRDNAEYTRAYYVPAVRGEYLIRTSSLP